MPRKFIATFKWKLLNNGFDYLYACILGLFIYFSICKSFSWISLTFIVVLFLLIIKTPKAILLALAFALVLIIIHLITKQHALNKYLDGNYKVIDVFKSGISIKENETNVFVYTKEEFSENDIVHIKGQIVHIDGVMKDYLYQHNIINGIFNSKIEMVQQSHSWRNNFIHWTLQGSDIYSKYISLFLLGIKNSSNTDIYRMSIEINVVHLFVISGFHMMIFNFIFTKLFTLLKINTTISKLLSLIILLIYLYILSFPLSASRAFIILVLYFVNSTFFKGKYSKITMLNLTMILMSCIHPRSISSLSFILTFTANYTIVLYNFIDFKNKKLKWFLFPICIYLSTLPIVVNVNKFISPLGLVWSVILSPFFSVIYVASIFLFPFKSFMELLYGSFDLIFHKIAQFNIVIPIEIITLNISLYIYLSASLIILIITYKEQLKKLII